MVDSEPAPLITTYALSHHNRVLVLHKLYCTFHFADYNRFSVAIDNFNFIPAFELHIVVAVRVYRV